MNSLRFMRNLSYMAELRFHPASLAESAHAALFSFLYRFSNNHRLVSTQGIPGKEIEDAECALVLYNLITIRLYINIEVVLLLILLL